MIGWMLPERNLLDGLGKGALPRLGHAGEALHQPWNGEGRCWMAKSTCTRT